MCWSVPGRIMDINGNMAVVEVGGVTRDVALDLIDGPEVGEYVLVHAGYALQKVSEDKARFTIEFFRGPAKDA
jgi:hydrogenase expression/formation protein HypC